MSKVSYILSMVLLFGSLSAEMSEEDQVKLSAIEQDQELALYFEQEFALMATSEVRIEKDFEIADYSFKVIFNPVYEKGVSGVMFLTAPMAMLFDSNAPKEILDWVAIRAHDIKHIYANINYSELSKDKLFGIR